MTISDSLEDITVCLNVSYTCDIKVTQFAPNSPKFQEACQLEDANNPEANHQQANQKATSQDHLHHETSNQVHLPK